VTLKLILKMQGDTFTMANWKCCHIVKIRVQLRPLFVNVLCNLNAKLSMIISGCNVTATRLCVFAFIFCFCTQGRLQAHGDWQL